MMEVSHRVDIHVLCNDGLHGRAGGRETKVLPPFPSPTRPMAEEEEREGGEK